MATRPADAFEPYLARLREIPFVRAATLRGPHGRGLRGRMDGILVVRTPDDEYELPVELMRTYLTYATADGVLAQMHAIAQKPWVLFAPYIPRPMGRYLAEHDVNYLDLAGNCRLVLGRRYATHVEGRTRERPAEEREDQEAFHKTPQRIPSVVPSVVVWFIPSDESGGLRETLPSTES